MNEGDTLEVARLSRVQSQSREAKIKKSCSLGTSTIEDAAEEGSDHHHLPPTPDAYVAHRPWLAVRHPLPRPSYEETRTLDWVWRNRDPCRRVVDVCASHIHTAGSSGVWMPIVPCAPCALVARAHARSLSPYSFNLHTRVAAVSHHLLRAPNPT